MAAFIKPLVGLLNDTAHVALAARIEQARIGKPRRARNVHLTAQRAGTLDQKRLRAASCGCDGGRYAGGPATADDYVI